MMQLHTMRKPEQNRAEAPRFDLYAEAFRAGQELYKTGLLAVVNSHRAALKKPAVDWPRVGATKYEEVWREGSARLLKYEAPASKAVGLPLLLVCSLINRPYILDLLAGRSVVDRLRAAGRQVWLLDWGTPTDESAAFGLEHFALGLLPRAAAVVCKASGQPKLHVLGYCMGGTLSLMAIAARKLPAASLIALATPVALHDDGLLSLWCRAPGFEADEIVRHYGNAPPHLLQPAFKMLDPVGLATKLVHLEDKVGDDAFVTFFLAMETWLEDSVAFPGRAFGEWVRMYRDDALAKGTLALAGKKIDLSAVDCPILTMIAESDYITPAASSLAIERLCPRAKHTLVRSPGGHIGLATSSSSQKKLWPDAARWLDAVDASLAGLVQSPKKPKPKKARS